MGLVGIQIGDYRIERELGQGGFGVVYIGVDVRLGRRAAIKQLLPELSGNRQIVERFFNEAKAAANINHPGIVEIYDVGWHTDGSAYFAMKLLDGDSLAKRLRAGPLPIALAATIARQIASAVAAAHACGIVHRDLKPDNVILIRDDEVSIGERAVVLDFGIAKLGGTQGMAQTRSGMLMGTPGYMSPEQCRGAGEVDHRTDVYALGCILFEMLTGRAPFVGEGPGEVMAMHQLVEPPTVRSLRADVPPELDALVAKLLAKKLDKRLQQMSDVQTALQTFATGGRSREQPVATPATSMPMPASPVAPEPRPDAISAAAQQANVPPQQSTLASARGEVALEPKRSSKKGLAVGLGALGVVGIGIAIAVGASGGSPSDSKDSGSGAAVIAKPKGKRTAYLLTGHGELNDYASMPPELKGRIPERRTTMLRKRLQDSLYDIKELPPAELVKGVSSAATLVMLLAPAVPLKADEWAALDRYVEGGGRLLVAVDPKSERDLGVVGTRFGLKVRNGSLTDDDKFLPQTGKPNDRRYVLTTLFAAHAATSGLAKKTDQGMVLVDSGALEQTDSAATRTVLVRSLETSWLETDDNFTFDKSEIRQRWPIAVAVRGPKRGEEAGYRALVFADIDLFADVLIRQAATAQTIMLSGPLLEDSINWLEGDEILGDESGVPPSTPTIAPAAAADPVPAAPQLADCRGFQALRQWPELQECAKRLEKTDPGNGKLYGDHARAQQAAKLALDDMKKAFETKDQEALYTSYNKIPSDSVYRDLARTVFDEAGTAFVNHTGQQAKALAESGTCKALDAKLKLLRDLAKKRAGTPHHYDEAIKAAQKPKCVAVAEAPSGVTAIPAPGDPADSKGTLQIVSKPPAKIHIDGVDTGLVTPAKLTLSPGKHKVLFVVGDDRFAFPVTVKANETVLLSKDLQ